MKKVVLAETNLTVILTILIHILAREAEKKARNYVSVKFQEEEEDAQEKSSNLNRNLEIKGNKNLEEAINNRKENNN